MDFIGILHTESSDLLRVNCCYMGELNGEELWSTGTRSDITPPSPLLPLASLYPLASLFGSDGIVEREAELLKG